MIASGPFKDPLVTELTQALSKLDVDGIVQEHIGRGPNVAPIVLHLNYLNVARLLDALEFLQVENFRDRSRGQHGPRYRERASYEAEQSAIRSGRFQAS